MSGRIKRRRRTNERNRTATATRIRRLCYLPRRKGFSLPLARGLRRSAVSNVAASRHHLQMTRRSRRASRSSVGVHPPKPYQISTPRSTSSRLSRSEGNVSNNNTVIYERQIWEGEILNEREVKQGRGRPRKQYLIQWEPSWVEAGRLTAPELLRKWKLKILFRSATLSSILLTGGTSKDIKGSAITRVAEMKNWPT